MASEVNERLRWQVAEGTYHVCEYCLVHEDDTFWGRQVDHILSRKHGGAIFRAQVRLPFRDSSDQRANKEAEV
jgi:hypothetical protein